LRQRATLQFSEFIPRYRSAFATAYRGKVEGGVVVTGDESYLFSHDNAGKD
jgi:hypothetical protein